MGKESKHTFSKWLKAEINKCKKNGEEFFIGIPEKWYEPIRFGCKNGHVSTRHLKSEAKRGNVCIACYEAVSIIPNHIHKDSELKEALAKAEID